jgi:glutamate-1-semialdehyde aminotransferase
MTMSRPSLSPSGFDRLGGRYLARTETSRRINEQQRPVLAHPRAANRFDKRWKAFVYPLVGTRASGSRMWDVDGNEYIDLTMGLGALLFGHQPAFLDAALREQLDAGNHLGVETALAGEVAARIVDATGHDRVALVNTGSEAVMTAIRLARAVTGRRVVAQFAGSYHGWYDGLVARRKEDGSSAAPAPGMLDQAVAETAVFDYGDTVALTRLRELGPRLAAILVEPVQMSNVGLQPRDFVNELRQVADATGAVLIFDEMVTGFRLARGGAQEWYGVHADLATYGKVLGGGLPIGVVAGKSELMSAIDGGVWGYGDDSGPGQPRTFFAGTFSRNPLTMAAANAVLREIEARGDTMYNDLADRAGRMATGLADAFAAAPAAYTVAHCGSVIVVKAESAEAGELMSYHLADRGVFAWVGGGWFLSTEHSDANCDAVVAAVSDSGREMSRL